MSRKRNDGGKRADTPRYLPTLQEIADAMRLIRLERKDSPITNEPDEPNEFNEEVMADRSAMKKRR